jgi:hypothetical protein
MALGTRDDPEGLADNDIHRLVRVTAFRLLVYVRPSGSWQHPNNPRSVTGVMDLGVMIGPQIAPGPQSGPFRVRIEARQRWGGVGQKFLGRPCVRSGSMMFCTETKLR